MYPCYPWDDNPWWASVPIGMESYCPVAWQAMWSERLGEAYRSWQREQAEQDKARSQLASNGEDTW